MMVGSGGGGYVGGLGLGCSSDTMFERNDKSDFRVFINPNTNTHYLYYDILHYKTELTNVRQTTKQ